MVSVQRVKPGLYQGSAWVGNLRVRMMIDRGTSGWWHWVAFRGWPARNSEWERCGRALTFKRAKEEMRAAIDAMPRIAGPADG